MSGSVVRDVIDMLKEYGVESEYFDVEPSIQLRIKNVRKYIATFGGPSAFVYVQYGINDAGKTGEIVLSQLYNENRVYIHVRTLNGTGEPEKYADLTVDGKLHKDANIDGGTAYIDIGLT